MNFSNPLWLWATLFVIPALSLLRAMERKASVRRVRKFFGSNQIENLVTPRNTRLDHINALLLNVGVILLFLGLARPLLEERPEQVDRLGIDFLVGVDTSKSMLAEDVEPNRLEVAKQALHYLLSRLQGDRMGILAFAGEARMIAPLTFDSTALEKVVESIDENTLWKGGTAISEVIALAAEKFEEKNLETRVLVLLTDGENLEGDAALAASDAFLNHQIQIFTIGVGTPQGAKIPLHRRNREGEITRTTYQRGPNRQEVITRIDETGLRDIAEATGGSFHFVGEDNEGVRRLYEEGFSTLAKRVESRELTEPVEGYRIFLIPALACLILQNFFVTGKRAKG